MTPQDNVAFLKKTESELRSAGALSPLVEAETLITHFGQMKKLDLFTGAKRISPSARRAVQKALQGRKKGKPLQQILGKANFHGHDFFINRDVLIPRPETEILVEAALRLIPDHPPLSERTTSQRSRRGHVSSSDAQANVFPSAFSSNALGRGPVVYQGQNPQILDIGTGSGCIAVSLTLQRPACRMTALDASRKALKVARKNVRLFGLSDKIQLVHSRLFGAFGKNKKAFWDVVVSNPPYVPVEDWGLLSREVRSEPRLALDGGVRGLETIEALLETAPFFIKKNGWLLVEIGLGQAVMLSKKLKRNAAFKNFWFEKDLNGIDRVLVAQHG